MRRVLVPLLLAAGLGLPLLAAAQGRAPRAHPVVDAAWSLGDRALDAVDATPAQRRAVVDRANEVVATLAPHEAAVRRWAGELERALTAETVSPAETEALRRRGLALADAMSADTVASLTDMANVLDAGQRQALLRLARREAARRLR